VADPRDPESFGELVESEAPSIEDRYAELRASKDKLDEDFAQAFEWLREAERRAIAMEERLRKLTAAVEVDRREPDKLLCHVQSARGFLLRVETEQGQAAPDPGGG